MRNGLKMLGLLEKQVAMFDAHGEVGEVVAQPSLASLTPAYRSGGGLQLCSTERSAGRLRTTQSNSPNEPSKGKSSNVSVKACE